MKTLQKLKATLLLSAALCLLWTHSYAQEDNRSYPSPDSKSLINRIQNSVNYNTGAVNIQAPLISVDAQTASVPVTLTYNTSGLKVGDLPTAVGMGWNLSAGGKITRIVKGYPDEVNMTTTYSLTTDGWGLKPCKATNAWLSYIFNSEVTLSDVYEKSKQITPALPFFDFDTEPDIFYFEIPGNSGIFVLDNDGRAHTIPYQNLSITFNRSEDNLDNHFIIKDTSGNEYKFGLTESSRETTKTSTYEIYDDKRHLKREFTCNTTWWLDEINPFEGEPVSFTYENKTYTPKIEIKDWFQVGLFELKDGKYSLIQYDDNYETVSEVTPKRLKKVACNSASAIFSYDKLVSAARNKTYEILSRIQTYTFANREAEDLYLDYSYFQNGTIRLDAVRKKYGNDLIYIYRFAYNNYSTFPNERSPFIDHWGYFNDKEPNEYNEFMPAINDGAVKVTGHSREPKLLPTQGNTLRSVTTSTGLTISYFYELNSVATATEREKPFGGLRIARIEENSSGVNRTVKRFEYKLASGASSGKAYQNKFLYYDNAPDGEKGEKRILVYSKCINNIFDFGGKHMSYSRVTEYFPNGSYNVYNYDEGTDHEDPTWEYYKTTPALSQETLDKMELLAPPTTYFWRRGLLTSQYAYDASGKLISQTENTYSFGPEKAKIKCFSRYQKEKRLFVYYWVSEPVFLTKTKVYSGKYNTASETVYTYDKEHMVPTTVTTTDAAGNTYETRTKCIFNYSNIASSVIADKKGMVAAIKYMWDKRALTIPIESINYKNGKVISGKLNLYTARTNGAEILGVSLGKECALKLTEMLSISSFTESRIYNTPSSGIFQYDPRYKTEISYDEYYGTKLLSLHKRDGIPHSVMYGYGNTLPIAVITNAVHSKDPAKNQVIYDSFETGANRLKLTHSKSGDYVLNGYYSKPLNTLKPGKYVVSYWRKPSTSSSRADWEYVEQQVTVTPNTSPLVLNSTIYLYDELRIIPVNAQITTCAYRPGIGKISETDPNGITTYYDYNKFGMLRSIADNDGKIIKKITYDNYTSNL